MSNFNSSKPYIIRQTLFTILVFVQFWVKGQPEIGNYAHIGFTKIGFYADGGFIFQLNRNEFLAGARYYGPDYVFETQNPGLSLNYRYLLLNKKWTLSPTLSGCLFYEKKSEISLLLTDVKAGVSVGKNWGDHITITSGIGIGKTLTNTKNYTTQKTYNSSYFNYEFSIGIHYFWHLPDSN